MVEWTQPNSITLSSPKDAGIKQIIVSVECDGVTLAELSMVVTNARQVLPAKGP